MRKEIKNKKNFPPAGEDFDELVIAELRRDPAFREQYIRGIVTEKDPKMLIVGLQRVVEAIGGVGFVAEETGLNRTNLYRVLGGENSPEFYTLSKILTVAGLHFTVEVNKPSPKRNLKTA